MITPESEIFSILANRFLQSNTVLILPLKNFGEAYNM